MTTEKKYVDERKRYTRRYRCGLSSKLLCLLTKVTAINGVSMSK